MEILEQKNGPKSQALVYICGNFRQTSYIKYSRSNMRKNIFGALILFIAGFGVATVNAQRFDRFQGTAVIYGSGTNTRTVTTTFDLTLSGKTSDAESARYHEILKAKGGQQKLADEIRKNDLGRVQFGGRLGPIVVAAFEREDGDKTKLLVVFERWMSFGELRAGTRSVDYPFGVIEIFFEPGKKEGKGTFIGAAKIRLGKNDDTGKDEIELEGFGTFPGKVMGVRQVETRLP